MAIGQGETTRVAAAARGGLFGDAQRRHGLEPDDRLGRRRRHRQGRQDDQADGEEQGAGGAVDAELHRELAAVHQRPLGVGRARLRRGARTRPSSAARPVRPRCSASRTPPGWRRGGRSARTPAGNPSAKFVVVGMVEQAGHRRQRRRPDGARGLQRPARGRPAGRAAVVDAGQPAAEDQPASPAPDGTTAPPVATPARPPAPGVARPASRRSPCSRRRPRGSGHDR